MTLTDAKKILNKNNFILEAEEYNLDDLVKMFVEKNFPNAENFDYREYDDGSISIFDIIYDPYNCGDDLEQEWDFLADFKNIEELKQEIGL